MLFCVFAIPTFAQKTDIFGYYFIEKATKDFKDISEIHLAGDYGAKQKPPFYGLIRLTSKKAKDFKLNKPTMNGKSISFTTKSVNGVSYSFSGKFVRLGNFPEERPEGKVLLKGTLTKMKGKTKLASGKFSFSYSAGD
jgi:hypothetical protein